MNKHAGKTLRLGDFVAAAFDQAMKITRDPQRAATLAALVVQRSLRRSGKTQLLNQLAQVGSAS